MGSGAEKKAGSGEKPTLSSQRRKYCVCSAAVPALEDTSLGRIISPKNSAIQSVRDFFFFGDPFLPRYQQV